MATLTSHATPAHNLSSSSRLEAAGLVDRPTRAEASYPSGDVEVSLSYFNPPEDGAKPYYWVEKPAEGIPQQNFGSRDVPVTVHDIRGHESEYTLDKDAFKLILGVPPSAETEFADDKSIEEQYYPELEKLLLENVPGSTRVVFFDHTIRRAKQDAHRTPVTRVHIDQTPASARERVVRHTGEDAEKLLQGRYRIINVWRPLNGPVQSFPLGFASSASVQDEDLIPIEHRYPDRTGATAGVVYNENQKWHYFSGMANEDRLLLECFDSEALKSGSKVQGGRVPHTAFVHPGTAENAVGRESIEVRALVFGP